MQRNIPPPTATVSESNKLTLNLCSPKIAERHLYEIFSQYGKITEAKVLNNESYIVFEKPDCAENALKSKHNTLYNGQTILCKTSKDSSRINTLSTSNDSQTLHPAMRRRSPSPLRHVVMDRPSYRNHDRREPSPRRSRRRSRSRSRSPRRHDRFEEGGPRYARERAGLPPSRGMGAGRSPPPSFRREELPRRGAAAAVNDMDRGFRDKRELDRDHLLAERGAPSNLPPLGQLDQNQLSLIGARPYDVAIVSMDHSLLTFAENIESRIQQNCAPPLVVHIVVLKEESHVAPCVKDLTQKGVLFAVIISHQNEQHDSCTLRLLHGTPQEHRNMPVDQAMNLMRQHFDDLLQSLSISNSNSRAQRQTRNNSVSKPPGYIPPSERQSYLLNLLADGRMLTMEELSEVINFVNERLTALGAKPIAQAPLINNASKANETAELQSKILNMINPVHNNNMQMIPPSSRGGGGGGDLMAPRNNVPSNYQQNYNSSQQKSIDLGNPLVKNALDKLAPFFPNSSGSQSLRHSGPPPSHGILSGAHPVPRPVSSTGGYAALRMDSSSFRHPGNQFGAGSKNLSSSMSSNIQSSNSNSGNMNKSDQRPMLSSTRPLMNSTGSSNFYNRGPSPRGTSNFRMSNSASGVGGGYQGYGGNSYNRF